MSKGDICSIDDCKVITRYGNICDNHRWRLKKYGSYDLPDRSIVKICRAPNCNSPVDKAQASLLCVMHRVRWSRHKSFYLPIKTLPDGIVHICKIHGELTETLAYTNENYSSYQCLACKRMAMKKFEKLNPERDSNAFKNSHYIGHSGFKIDKEYYDGLLEQQNGVCNICKLPETIKCNSMNDSIRRLAIDHCHRQETKGEFKVRGLLCQNCNTLLGRAKDSVEILQAAIDYLNIHK